MSEQKIIMQDTNGEETEFEVLVENEKNAKDFLKSKRAISFLIWLVVAGVVVPVAQLVFPEFTVDVHFFVENLTNIVALVISGYTVQEIAIAILEAVSVYFDGRE